jgi:hypothetical protein
MIKKGEIMKRNILIAAVALLASGAALADNASGVWGGFTGTATDGVVNIPTSADHNPITNSTGVNTPASGTPATTGSFAGIAGYYSGVAASAAPTAGDTTGAQTINTIGIAVPAAAANTDPATGVNGYGQALSAGAPGSVDLAGQSYSSAASSVVGTLFTANASGATGSNGILVSGAPGSTIDIIGTSQGTSTATNNGTAGVVSNPLWDANATSVGSSGSYVNGLVGTPTFGYAR